MMGGGGAWVGWIENQAQDGLAPKSTPLDLGYATAGTDTGHQAFFGDASWALNNQKAKEDFAHVAVHRTTEVSKAIIADFYDDDIDYSYFFGCSRGGGQALIEAQRYPQDFDGLIAGAPEPECLTEEQLAAIQTVYRGPVVHGQQVFPGFPFGGETVGWPFWITRPEGAGAAAVAGGPNRHFAFGTQFFQYFLYSDPDWTYEGYTFDNWAEVSSSVGALLNSTNPDLSALNANGGKVILWHGWVDAALTPLASIDYYEAAAARDPNVKSHLRLFLLPGVGHCAGGPGPDQVDWISAIERWVEDGVAPDRIIAAETDAEGNTTMRRPLCPYPEEAVYNGSGNPEVAESFVCEVLTN